MERCARDACICGEHLRLGGKLVSALSRTATARAPQSHQRDGARPARHRIARMNHCGSLRVSRSGKEGDRSDEQATIGISPVRRQRPCA